MNGNGKRSKGFREYGIVTTGGADLLIPPNPNRCGLLLCPTTAAGAVTFTFDGSDPTATGQGIRLNGTAAPFYLGEEACADVLTGPVRAQAPAAANLSALEWFYLT